MKNKLLIGFILFPLIAPIILMLLPILFIVGVVFFYVKGVEGIHALPIKESWKNWLYDKIANMPEQNPNLHKLAVGGKYLLKAGVFLVIGFLLLYASYGLASQGTPVALLMIIGVPILGLVLSFKKILGWLAKKQPINETHLEVETDSSIVEESQKQQTNETLLNEKQLEVKTSSPIIEESLKQQTNQNIKSNGLLWKTAFLVIFEVIAVCVISFLIVGFYSNQTKYSDKLDVITIFFISILTSILAFCLLFVHKKYINPCLFSLNLIENKEMIDLNFWGKKIYQFYLVMFTLFFMYSLSMVMVKIIQSNYTSHLSEIVPFICFSPLLVIFIRHIQLSTGDYWKYLPKQFLVGIFSSLILGTALTSITYPFTPEGAEFLGWFLIYLIFPHTLILIVLLTAGILKLAPSILKILVKGFYFSIRDPKEYINDSTEKHGFFNKFWV